jgi:hypothetical protein
MLTIPIFQVQDVPHLQPTQANFPALKYLFKCDEASNTVAGLTKLTCALTGIAAGHATATLTNNGDGTVTFNASLNVLTGTLESPDAKHAMIIALGKPTSAASSVQLGASATPTFSSSVNDPLIIDKAGTGGTPGGPYNLSFSSGAASGTYMIGGDGTMSSVTLTGAGSGYTAPPTVTATNGGLTGARVLASINTTGAGVINSTIRCATSDSATTGNIMATAGVAATYVDGIIVGDGTTRAVCTTFSPASASTAIASYTYNGTTLDTRSAAGETSDQTTIQLSQGINISATLSPALIAVFYWDALPSEEETLAAVAWMYANTFLNSAHPKMVYPGFYGRT